MQNAIIAGNLTGHYSAEELEERERKAGRFKRKEVLLQLPDYLEGDEVGQMVWVQVLNDAEEMEIFDNLDRETLGSYCSITSRIVDLRRKYRTAIKGNRAFAQVLEVGKELRMLEAQQLNYAGKMGLTPESRARLAQKVVQPEQDDGADLYG